jgi:3-methyladenine DNA glycosylase AlkD
MKNFKTSKFVKLQNKKRAKISARFFKTEKGQYGEGDEFLGITAPEIRKFCKENTISDLGTIKGMLQNEFHEIRFAALVYLRTIFEKGDQKTKKKVFDFYIKNSKKMNNWDLVDVSTPYIVSAYLLENKKERKIIHEFSKSNNIWERRIAVLATFKLLKNGDFKDLEIVSKRLLKDEHDLIHKAVGWMLREAGKIDKTFLKKFLDQNAEKIPRTTLRYSIEKLSIKEKKFYMNK